VRWSLYSRWGSASPKGQKVLPETWFREEIMRYLGQKPFDLVVDITGSSLFYTTFAARVPAKACVIWALDDLPALAQTTQKGLSKIFGTYVAFDAVTTTDEQLLTRIQAGFSQTACGTLPCERLEKRLGRLGISVVNTPPCCEQRFDFSIIMAVYKVEPYLREAIESVVKQDIGFENHVQLILVDDGSPDNSGAICDEYAAKYPENIIVIHKENGGVASARNAGIEVATGTYLNFMDPDDKLSLNTLSKVKAFYIAHPSGVDIATIPVFFFEAIKGPHPTNDKFKQGTRIVNLLEEPEIIQCNVAPTFIRKSVIKGTRFCLNLNYAEDGCFIQTLLLRSPALGVITGCKYFYRKRKSGTSALQKNNPMFYQTPRYFYLPYVRKAQAVFGRVPRFVACVLSHYLQWDLKSITGIPEDIGLSQDEREKCHSEYLEAFQFADDYFILNSKNVYLEHRLAYFRTKYGTAPQLQHLEQDAGITFSAISDVLTYPFLQWHSMRAEKGKLFLCVAFVQFSGLPEATEVFAKCGEKVFAAKLLASRDGTSFMDEPMYQRHLYEFEFAESDLPKTARLTFHFTQGGETYQATRISRHFRFPLSDQFAAAYCILNKKCILARGATLIITDKYHHWKKEL
ncbi:MAG: glycosyltransferase family 2 protein, partial [Kiritimatiellae bacterium]|nr:glycosyltransferase family 2 protein [Kiritimatiellia bacterium]